MTTKKIILLIILAFTLFLAQPLLAASQLNNMLNEAAGNAGYNTAEDVAETGLARILGTIVRTFISIIGVIFISYTIYGGYLYMTAAGNEEKTKKSIAIIRDGIIGIIIILGSYAIYYTVTYVFYYGA